ncbi:terminase small subunit [Enterobacter huaxiensis]|uniref:terminase small subunit n=1 Tax=Enterobacter huaxiensis TaxID=2494702 RepID=UPI002175CD90|nr:terminase small subunit [Enterobacter huaxiensis]MCS5452507.1 terminase small subunit [Enterobacter huaxiensis]
MMNDAKRIFAQHISQGLTQKDAALAAGYSELSAATIGCRLSKDPDVLKYLKRLQTQNAKINNVSGQNTPEISSEPAPIRENFDNPLDFLKAVMNNTGLEMDTRKDAAKAILPYLHAKKGETGKKDEKAKAASVAAGRFAAMMPPVPKGGKDKKALN